MHTAIIPKTPINFVDWEKVEHFEVTLNKPWPRSKDGALQFRLGTTDARRNLNFNAHDRRSGPVYYPGKPVFWPDDAPCKVGESFTMPASSTATILLRSGVAAPDPVRQAGFMAFGFFNAPVTDDDGVTGYTIGSERTRIASFWGWFKMPTKGDGTLNPPMVMKGPPEVPHVTIKLLDRNLRPVLVDGAPVEIDVRDFWDFDNPGYYDLDPVTESDQATAFVQGLTHDEIEKLRVFLKAKPTVKHGEA